MDSKYLVLIFILICLKPIIIVYNYSSLNDSTESFKNEFNGKQQVFHQKTAVDQTSDEQNFDYLLLMIKKSFKRNTVSSS